MKIRDDLLPHGVRIQVNDKKYDSVYPAQIWKAFPAGLKREFADTLAYFFTAHFGLEKPQKLEYLFPPPLVVSMFVHGLFYSLPEAVLEIPEARFTTAGLLKTLYNSGVATSFRGIPYPKREVKPYTPKMRTIIPFSFGKDSLLTYAISRELNLRPVPVFFVEPTSPFENRNKERLRQSFQKEFNEKITPFPIVLGNLRESGGLLWGWDLLLTQYTTLLLPYIFFQKAKYLFWSNEQSTNESEIDKEGYSINTTFEQATFWTVHLNNLLRIFSTNVTVASIIEPIHELAILYILHHRYPQIGKYQLSCFNDEPESKHQRWCGHCYECARVYIFLLAVGIDPKRVGFVDDMLDSSKKHLYYMFDRIELERPLDILFQSWGERLIAFYLAWKRGVQGDLIDLFVQQLLPRVTRERDELYKKYFTTHSTETIPQKLKGKVLTIFKEELGKLRHEITQETLAPIEKFS